MKKVLISCALIASSFFTMTGISHANAYKSAEIIVPIQNIRQEVAETSLVISKVAMGQEVVILEENENWTKIKFGSGIEGYIDSSSIKILKTGIINKDRVNLRTLPTTESDVITIMGVGSKVQVVSQEAQWTRIRFEDKEGYVFNEL